jgi:pilus assembly protein Flp/PilA
MSKLVARFAKDESGATAIEYGLIAALIGIAIMVGSSLNNLFTRIANKLNGSAAA